MNSQKFILAVLAGTVVYFLLGWVVYGILLRDMMASASASGFMRADADMVWWALVAGNLAFGFLLTYLVYRTGVSTASGGATLGFIVAGLMALGGDLVMYATSTMLTRPAVILVDVLATALMAALATGVVAWVYHAPKKTIAVA